MEQKRTCPQCNLIFEAAPSATGNLTCPLCDAVFSVRPPVMSNPSVPPAPATSVRHVFRGCVAVAAVLFLLGGLVYAFQLTSNLRHKNVRPEAEREREEAKKDQANEPERSEQPIADAPIAPEPLRPITQSPRPPTALASTPVQSSLAERVNTAIDRGVAYLRKRHSQPYEYQSYLGLLGLTLLECDIPARDPSVQQIAAWLRSREREMSSTYELTLAILFLDRLNEPRDHGLIQRYGQRLLQGQLEGGTWTYSCFAAPKRRNQGPLAMPTISWGGNGPPQLPPLPGGWGNSPNGNRPVGQRTFHFRGDNSNTQFAILGLWVAQRHGVAVRQALLQTEQYFRATQHTDGGWSYHALTNQWRDSMTCAGLMSLAMRHGSINAPGRDTRTREAVHVHDAAISRGLEFLGASMARIGASPERIVGVDARDPLYFLWSLERMAVIYDLKKLGDYEWYPWAAEMLLEVQKLDGSWRTPCADPISTCFALLILKRSNFAQDLQLAVQQPNSPGLISRPRDPSLLPGTAVRPAAAPPIGPGTAQAPQTNGVFTKPGSPAGVMEIPLRK